MLARVQTSPARRSLQSSNPPSRSCGSRRMADERHAVQRKARLGGGLCRNGWEESLTAECVPEHSCPAFGVLPVKHQFATLPVGEDLSDFYHDDRQHARKRARQNRQNVFHNRLPTSLL